MIKKKLHLFILLFLSDTKTHTIKLQNFIEIITDSENSKEFLDRILPDTLFEKQQKEAYKALQKLNFKADKIIVLHIEKITSQDISELKRLEDIIKKFKKTFNDRFHNNYFDSNDVNLLNSCAFSLTFINTLLQTISQPKAICNKNN